MKHPQVINLNEDDVIAIDGLSVIDATTEVLMSASETTINVDIELWDLMTNSGDSIANKVMTYQIDPDVWTINISDISASLVDRHKFVAKISTAAVPEETANMRTFKLDEFAVDNDSFEAVWMRLPYEVVMTPTPKLVWYAVGDIGGTPLYEALAYQGGVGTVAATDPSRVTHRGEIVVVP